MSVLCCPPRSSTINQFWTPPWQKSGSGPDQAGLWAWLVSWYKGDYCLLTTQVSPSIVQQSWQSAAYIVSLVSGSVEYPMPYASCLGLPRCCGQLLCCVCLSSNLLDCSSACLLFWASAASFYTVHICTALWDSLSGLMHSGIVCLASQAHDWAAAFWDGLSGLWLVNLWLVLN